MKKMMTALVLGLVFGTTAFCAETPWNRKLPFKEALVSYEISGTMKGSETVYVKEYGATIASYRSETASVFGVNDESRELILTTPDWVYTVDLSDNTGTKQVNPKRVIREKFNELSRADQERLVKNSEELGISVVGDMSGSVEKKADKILGYTCDKVRVMGMDSYTLTGTDFPVKVSGSFMGITISETATAIDKGRVDASKFKLPPGADIRHEPEADRVVREQIDMMFASLLAGKRPQNPQEKAAGDMKEAMKAMEEFRESGAMENFGKQIQGLLGTAGKSE